MKAKTQNLLWIIVACIICHALDSRPAGAQGQFRAEISRIAFRRNDNEREIKGRTDSVQYKRYNEPDWISARRKDRLYDRDRVLIRPYVYAKLQMDAPVAGAEITLWGESTDTLLPAAAYEIQEDPVRLGYYQLFVTYGSFVASNLRGMISSGSGALKLTHVGTRYLMTVDRETGRTFVFVEEGEVIATASGDALHLQAMEAAEAFPGGTMQRVSLSVQESNDYLRQIQSNHIELWKNLTPWWQKPGFYVPAAAGAVVIGVVIWRLIPRPGRDATGTITVNW